MAEAADLDLREVPLQAVDGVEIDGAGGGEVALAREVGAFAVGEAAHDLGDHEVGVGIALAVAVRAHVDGHAVDGDGEVGAVVQVEAAQEVLVGLALAAVLGDDEAGRGLQQFPRAVDGAGLELGGQHHALARRLRLADSIGGRVDRLDRVRSRARRLRRSGRLGGDRRCWLLLGLWGGGLLLGGRRSDGDRGKLPLRLLLGVTGVDGEHEAERADEARGQRADTHYNPPRARRRPAVPLLTLRGGQYDVDRKRSYLGQSWANVARKLWSEVFMQRITITIDAALAEEIDRLSETRGYQNRSEAVRDLVRAGIARTRPPVSAASHCVAGLVYVYEQGRRELPKRLVSAFQEHHDLTVATMRMALDHETCMEVAVLKGRTPEVEHFAQHVIAERGVRHGQLFVVPAEIETERHAHGDGRAHAHQHIRVR
jgi:CopG family transcriptional regulator, nickel-responsive regulator